MTRPSLPAEYTVVKVDPSCSAARVHTPSLWTRIVPIHFCWPSDHNFIVPSELADNTWKIKHFVFLLNGSYAIKWQCKNWKTWRKPLNRTEIYGTQVVCCLWFLGPGMFSCSVFPSHVIKKTEQFNTRRNRNYMRSQSFSSKTLVSLIFIQSAYRLAINCFAIRVVN